MEIPHDPVDRRATKHRQDAATGTLCQTKPASVHILAFAAIHDLPIECLKATSLSDLSTRAPTQDEKATAENARTRA